MFSNGFECKGLSNGNLREPDHSYMTPEALRQYALKFEDTVELPHFEKTSFRTGGRIFASLDPVKGHSSLLLSEVDQSIYCQMKPLFASPATGAWGRQGWTLFVVAQTPTNVMKEAIRKSYEKVRTGTKPVSKKKISEKIQTLHPTPGKTNKKIDLSKYETIKAALLGILSKGEYSHTDLMERIYQKVTDTFEGGVQWYGETVKLDLEARGVIERTKTKPEKYRLVKKKK